MADLVDPLESGLSSLVAPLTSIFPDSVSANVVTPVPPPTDSPLLTDASITVDSNPATPLATSSTEKTTTSKTRTKSASSDDSPTATAVGLTSVTVSSSSRDLSNIPSTLVTSTSSSASSSISVPPAPDTTSNPVAASTPNLQDQPSSSSSSSGNNISTAGIAVASVFAALIIIAALWLIFRFCPPIRRRYEIWKYQRQKLRSYRETIDGPAVPPKDVSPVTTREVVRNQTQRPFSFLRGQTPQNLSAEPQQAGLGLGRVSMLRNHSLLRRAGHDVPREAKLAALPRLQTGQAQRQPAPPEAHWYRGSQVRRPPPPQLQLQRPRQQTITPVTAVERISQIGLAISSTPTGAMHEPANVHR